MTVAEIWRICLCYAIVGAVSGVHCRAYRDTQKYLGAFHFEIGPYFYVLGCPGFIYDTATAMDVCMREISTHCSVT